MVSRKALKCSGHDCFGCLAYGDYHPHCARQPKLSVEDIRRDVRNRENVCNGVKL